MCSPTLVPADKREAAIVVAPEHLPATGRAARNHFGGLHQVRLEGGVQPRRTFRLARRGSCDARPAQRSCRTGLPKLGSNWDRCGAHFVEPIEGPR